MTVSVVHDKKAREYCNQEVDLFELISCGLVRQRAVFGWRVFQHLLRRRVASWRIPNWITLWIYILLLAR